MRMPFRLILILALVLFEGAFIGFNIENTCNVWLFTVFEAVPVYMTALIAFAAGVLLSMLFFAFGRRKRRARERAAAQSAAGAAPLNAKKHITFKGSKERRAGGGGFKAPQDRAASASYSPPADTGADGGHKDGV